MAGRRTWKVRKGERTFVSCCRRMATPGEWVTATYKRGSYMVPTYYHRYCLRRRVVGG